MNLMPTINEDEVLKVYYGIYNGFCWQDEAARTGDAITADYWVDAIHIIADDVLGYRPSMMYIDETPENGPKVDVVQKTISALEKAFSWDDVLPGRHYWVQLWKNLNAVIANAPMEPPNDPVSDYDRAMGILG